MQLSCDKLTYSYTDTNGSQKTIIKDFNYTFNSGKTYAITGKSGSGKSTLLYLLGGLDIPSKGSILFNGRPLSTLKESYLQKHCGFIFQNYNLIPYLNAVENVNLSAQISNINVSKQDILNCLSLVSLDQEINTRPVKNLSGGEQQRVAIARTLIKNADIILADEPTGNLDGETSDAIVQTLLSLKNDQRIIILVTHSKEIVDKCDIVLNINAYTKEITSYENK